MTTSRSMLTATLSVAFLGLISSSNALALCGGAHSAAPAPSSWRQPFQDRGGARLLRTSLLPIDDGDRDGDDERKTEAIVGLWQVKFLVQGPPGGADVVVDSGFQQWHSDGTEILNSGKPPITSSFCLGVWKKYGERKYKLNHYAIAWNDTGTALVGPANIHEQVTVSPNGKTMKGRFVIDQFDTAGNTLAHVEGTIQGTRLDTNSPPATL